MKDLSGAIEALPEVSLDEIASSIRADSKQSGLFLVQGPELHEELIPVALTPFIVSQEAARYMKGFFRGIRRTVNRILSHYFTDPALQETLPLREAELSWLKASCPDGIPRPQTIFERFDTNLGLQVDEQLSTFQVIEFNAVGVGCIYFMPAVNQILEKQLFPHLKEHVPHLQLEVPQDYRQLLLQDLQTHAKALECSSCRVAFVERREAVAGGADEFSKLIPYFTERGSPALIADPREIEYKEGQFFAKESPIDVVYRDFQLEEVVSIKTHGGSVGGIETSFAQNRVVSTVFGEFDHKSLCELLTNPDFVRYFNPQELRAAKKRFPWTRLIYERKTSDPEGKEVDLPSYIREHRESLVLKPNRSYGGEGVVVGEAVKASAWEQALEKALEKPRSFVVQVKVEIAKAPVMVIKGSGKPKLEDHYVTLSVTATPRGIAFVGRCSPDPVVNISQGGGLVPVFLDGR